VTGLMGNTSYHVAVYEYNDAGIAVATNYGSSGGTGSQLTAAGLDGLQVTTAGVLYKVNFDSTVAFVNNGPYGGSGFSPNPATGQLHSNAWAVTGWSDGNLAFGDTRTTGDFARGFAAGHVSTNGMFATELAPGNRCLLIQPGGGDWAPGTLTLRLQNQTGTLIHTLDIGYDAYVYNDQSRGSSFNSSYAVGNSPFTDITSLNLASPEAPDAAPAWVWHPKTAQLTGLSIPPGAYFYIRWSGADLPNGSGSRDEFALDNISVIANNMSNSPLPVHFTGLKLVEKSRGILVEWTNETEEHVGKYVVERSVEGRNFVAIGEVAARLNTNAKASYSFLDETHPNGHLFYRIKAIQADGSEVYSGIVRINTDKGITTLTVSPNPVTGNEIRLQFTKLPKGTYSIRLFSEGGMIQAQTILIHDGGSVTEVFPFHVGTGGLYFLQVSGPVHFHKKLIVE
jgi:hypothetical protein